MSLYNIQYIKTIMHEWARNKNQQEQNKERERERKNKIDQETGGAG